MALVSSASETARVGKTSPGGRVIVAPISSNLDEVMQLLDWYAENISSPADRLVLVRLLIPDCSPAVTRKSTRSSSAASAAESKAHRRGGSASSSAASSTSSSEDSNDATSAACPLDDDDSMEAQMERQLEASMKLEIRLVRRIRERNKSRAGAGPRSFRFIHTFGSEFTDSLLAIAAEQGASAILAPLSAFAADHDLARTYHLYKKARIGVIHAPEF